MVKLQLKDQIGKFFSEEDDFFSVLTENGIEKKLAKDLVEGDLIIGNKKYSDNLNYPYPINFCSNTFTYENSMTLELAEFLGYLLSCCPCVNGNTIIVSEPKSIDAFYKFFTDFFGSSFSFKIFDKKLIIEVEDNVKNFFYGLGIFFNDFSVPHCVKASSNEYICSFLSGFFKNKMDFELDKMYHFQIVGLQENIASNIQDLLDLIGVYSTAIQKDNEWILRIGGRSNLQRLLNSVKLDEANKLKIIINNNAFKANISSPTLKNFFAKKLSEEIKNNLKKDFDLYEIEEFIEFDGRLNNLHYVHMNEIFENPVYYVSKVEIVENTTSTLTPETFLATSFSETLLKQENYV